MKAAMTESEWLTCDSIYEMLSHLDGKISDQEFMRFSVECCRRIWPLISDSRSRAAVDATPAFLAGTLTAEDAGAICYEWQKAYEEGEVQDLVGGSTNEAIDSVFGLGYGHALQVSAACFESVASATTAKLSRDGGPQCDLVLAWEAAQRIEIREQCNLLRQLFSYLPNGSTVRD